MSEKSSTARICKFSTGIKCHPKRDAGHANKDTVRAPDSLLSVAGDLVPKNFFQRMTLQPFALSL